MFFFLARKYRNNISNLFEAGIFSRFFFLEHRGACLGGLALGRAHTKGIVPTPKKVWVESNETGFQSLARRSRYSIRPLTFECDCFLTQDAFWGSGTGRPSFGLNSTRPAQIWPYVLACRTRTSARNRRVKDARRSITGPLSAASPRYLRIGDSDFGAVKARFLEMATYNRSQTGSFSGFPPAD